MQIHLLEVMYFSSLFFSPLFSSFFFFFFFFFFRCLNAGFGEFI